MKKKHLQTEFIKFLKENRKEQEQEPEAKETTSKKPNPKIEIQLPKKSQDEVESDVAEEEEADDILTEILRDWKKYRINNEQKL